MRLGLSKLSNVVQPFFSLDTINLDLRRQAVTRLSSKSYQLIESKVKYASFLRKRKPFAFQIELLSVNA